MKSLAKLLIVTTSVLLASCGGGGGGSDDTGFRPSPTDAAPTITSTDPINDATAIPPDARVSIRYSEPVNATSAAYTLLCAAAPQSFTIEGNGSAIHVLRPNAALPGGARCIVSVVATQISDADNLDPPDNLAADFTTAFTVRVVDEAPRVVSTVPVNNQQGVAVDAPLTVRFSEAVNATSAFTLLCNGQSQNFATNGQGTAEFTLTPASPLPQNAECVLTVLAAGITDLDPPPTAMAQNVVVSFRTQDQPPRVIATDPANNAASVPPSARLTVNFNEPVTATASAYQLACNDRALSATLTGNGSAVHVLAPSAAMPVDTSCRLTIVADQISDVDSNDPPDNLQADVVVSFTVRAVDEAPRVVSTVPTNNQQGVSVTAPLTVRFSEPVNATSAFTLLCGGQAQNVVVTGQGTPEYTLTPAAPLPQSAACVLTVIAAGITDLDPPTTPMAQDVVVNFRTQEVAPRVLATDPANNATNVSPSARLTVTYSEAVTATALAYQLACAERTQTVDFAGNGTVTHVVTPAAALPLNSTCRLTIVADQISDVDANDPPDNLEANVVVNFTVPEQPGVRIEPVSTRTTPLSLVAIATRVSNASGGVVPDGTIVRLQISPPGVGLLSAGTTAAANQSIVLAESVEATTVAGLANFRFHSRAIGTANLVASATIGSGADARTVNGQTTIVVEAGAPNDPRLSLQIQANTLPLPLGLSANQSVYVGSPFVSEITVTQRRLDGTLVNSGGGGGGGGAPECNGGSGAAAAIGSGLNSAALWLPAEGVRIETVNGQQVRTILLCRSITLGLNSGRSIFYVVALDTQGNSTLTVTATDPQTGETLQSIADFRITTGTPQVPSTVLLLDDGSPVYINTVNGAQSKPLQALVRDGGGTVVPNAAAGVNNVRLEIVGGAQGGDRLRSINAAGQSVAADSIVTRTASGIAGFAYESGTRSGVVTIRAIADRADNNVDNGISDPVSTTRGFVVSDGRLFDVQITVPTINAIVVSPPSITASAPGIPPGPGVPTIPISPDGTYNLSVSALAVDRFGNPAAPGTELRFGTIDSPIEPDGSFAISGGDGNPQEGGTAFTATTGRFTVAGGGAGPGDTVLVFGEGSNGNRDLESARTVRSVQSPTALTVESRFNLNDDTGTSVDNGPVLPYVVGRATTATIPPASQTVQTDSRGVARASLTYPVTQVGRLAAIWAQGSGDIPASVSDAELVTDVELRQLPGVAPGALTSTPARIRGNATVPVTVCVTDFLGTGIRGVPIGFRFNLFSGVGSIEGVTGQGTLPRRTGADGCVTVQVTTNGVTVPAGGTTGAASLVEFTSGALSDTTEIVIGEQLLTLNPNEFTGGDGGVQVTATLSDEGGTGIAGVQLIGSCASTGSATITVGPIPRTNANGQTIIDLIGVGFTTIGGTPPTVTCTFSTPGGRPSAIFTWRGVDVCASGFSPLPPACPNGPRQLAVNFSFLNPAPANGGGSITSLPAGINCVRTGPAEFGQCALSFDQGTIVSLTATAQTGFPPPNTNINVVFCRWQGACSGSGATTTVTVGSTNATCTAVFNTATPPTVPTCP
jgi:methionine-rich copper-binding protein CopC